VNGYRVVLRKIAFDNGVIYGINGVLRPPGEGGDCDVATTLSTWVNQLCCQLICCYQLSHYHCRLIVQNLADLIVQWDILLYLIPPLNNNVCYRIIEQAVGSCV